MTELLFIVSVFFVVYVIHSIINESKESAVITPEFSQLPMKPEPVVIEKVAESTPIVEIKTVAKTKKALPKTKSAIQKETKNESVTTTKSGFKNPTTGESTTIGNYRFAKRWVKEALVSEGLLEKIYKNNELTPDLEVEIKNALLKLEQLEKYRV